MRACLRIRALLPRLSGQEAGPLETLEARRHLDECERCRRRAEAHAAARRATLPLPAIASAAVPDVASTVMDRLRSLKRQALADGIPLPQGSRWSSLALLAGVGLATPFLPGAPISRALARPLSALQGWLSGEWTREVQDVASAAIPLAARATQGGLRLELPVTGAPEIVLGLQIVATALGVLFTIAIPAGALAAYLIRGSRRS